MDSVKEGYLKSDKARKTRRRW